MILMKKSNPNETADGMPACGRNIFCSKHHCNLHSLPNINLHGVVVVVVVIVVVVLR